MFQSDKFAKLFCETSDKSCRYLTHIITKILLYIRDMKKSSWSQENYMLIHFTFFCTLNKPPNSISPRTYLHF